MNITQKSELADSKVSVPFLSDPSKSYNVPANHLNSDYFQLNTTDSANKNLSPNGFPFQISAPFGTFLFQNENENQQKPVEIIENVGIQKDKAINEESLEEKDSIKEEKQAIFNDENTGKDEKMADLQEIQGVESQEKEANKPEEDKEKEANKPEEIAMSLPEEIKLNNQIDAFLEAQNSTSTTKNAITLEIFDNEAAFTKEMKPNANEALVIPNESIEITQNTKEATKEVLECKEVDIIISNKTIPENNSQINSHDHQIPKCLEILVENPIQEGINPNPIQEGLIGNPPQEVIVESPIQEVNDQKPIAEKPNSGNSKQLERETLSDTDCKSSMNFKAIKCPSHCREDISFICNAPDCPRKFICSRCLVDDLKKQTRHHIIHEAFLIPYDENVFRLEYEKFVDKKLSFEKILEDQDYQLLLQVERGETEGIVQKKYNNEIAEIEGFLSAVSSKTEEILEQYKGLIRENVAVEASSFLKEMLRNFAGLKDEIKAKSKSLREIQRDCREVFAKPEEESSSEKILFFLEMHKENQEELLFQRFSEFVQGSMKVLREYTTRESNRALKYEFYVNLMNTLKTMINDKIPKNLLNSNYSLLLKTKANLSRELENSRNGPAVIPIEKPEALNLKHGGDAQEQKNNSLPHCPVEKIVSKNSFQIDYPLVLDLCLIGPTEKNEYFVATCCSREKFIKIWTLNKSSPPQEHKTLEGHNKSTYKLFYCHEKKWLLSAGMDGSVKSWDMTRNFEVGIYYKEERDPVNSIAYNATFDLFASSHTLFTRIWKIRKEYFVKIEADFAVQEPTDLLLLNFPSSSEDRCRLVIGTERGELFFCDFMKGNNLIKQRKEPMKAHNKSVWKLYFNQNRKYVISCCKDDQTIIFWDPYNMERLEEFTFLESKMIKGFFWNQESEEIVISNGNNQVFFLEWNNNEHQIRRIYEAEHCFGFNEIVWLKGRESSVLVVYTAERGKGGKNWYYIKYVYF